MAGCHHCASDDITDNQRKNPLFRRILWIALISNAVMFVAEIIASVISSSVSLQADALDFFADSVNYAITLAVSAMALLTRARAALFKAMSMGLFGVFVIASAIYHHLASSVPDHQVMAPLAVIALVVNVAVALLLYRYRAGDSNMRSIWLCSRNDAIGNIAVLAAAGGVMISASGWPDILVALLIATLSLSAAFQIFKQAGEELRSFDRV